MEGSSICYYPRIGTRKVNVDARGIHEIKYRFLPCRCKNCTPGERHDIGTHASKESAGSFESTCGNTVNMEIRHYEDMRR